MDTFCMLADDFFDTHQPPVNDVMGGAAPVNDIAGDAHWSDEDEDDDGLVVEFTRGVVLNTREEEKVNKLVEELKEDFLGRPFVHRLTTSNVDAGNMKLPYRVAISLGIPKEGMVGLRLDTGDARYGIPYSTSVDGRIVLAKKEWMKFALKSKLKVDKHIFVYFKTTTKAQLDVTIVFSKL